MLKIWIKRPGDNPLQIEYPFAAAALFSCRSGRKTR